MTTPPLEAPLATHVPTVPAPELFLPPYGEDPIRAELFGLEHLESHARQLAAASKMAPASSAHPLLHRFDQNRKQLVRCHRLITEAFRRREAIGSDAEWLLDNYHIIADALREIEVDLPGGYEMQLPKLAGTPLAGFPRVYAIAISLLAHTDCTLDELNLERFVQAYQSIAPLAIGELWAVPIMLRLVLVENLRRLGEQMLRAWSDRRDAEALAALYRRQTDQPQHSPLSSFTEWQRVWKNGRGALKVRVRQKAEELASESFVVHLLQSLRDLGPAGAIGVEWLESQLAQQSATPTDVLRRENQRQAANQVSVGNCVTSLRLLASIDWNAFFERTSLVEAILRDDPSGAYAHQDFTTRDRYRQRIEQIARGTKLPELEVARRLVLMTRRASENLGFTPSSSASESNAARQIHVGYYLMDQGRPELERELGYKSPWSERFRNAILHHPKRFYFGLMGSMIALIMGMVVGLAWSPAVSPGILVLILLATLLPAGELANGLVNYFVTYLLPPRVLAKREFKEGIPADCATFVVMPSLLLRAESATVLLERLEVHYLSNNDPHLYFALLTDFADAPAEKMPEDDAFLQTALEGVKALNQRYAPGGPDRFYLFHRRRLWSPGQACWMGLERKRGKLHEFNRLLRGACDTSFMIQSGDLSPLPKIRYVITLDADTGLPRDAARRMVGTLAHPLNQPHFDPAQGRVVEGYAILQPRVSLRITSADKSWFARLFMGSAGIDPYTTAVSDVYQDLFGSGSFTGKGIYEVNAFEAAVGDTFPENHILSHDLIEGNYARCGLATDIELLDDFPARYNVYARREHRWARGDWQILPWLFKHVPGPSSPVPGNKERGTPDQGPVARHNPLPLLERWKIFDNLRRSLTPPALVMLLVLGWTILPSSPWLWTGLAGLALALPIVVQLLGAVVQLTRLRGVIPLLRQVQGDWLHTMGQVVMSASFLMDQALSMLDAIARTLTRLTLTRRNLLEWETAATTERRLGIDVSHFLRAMWLSPVLAAGLALLVWLVHPHALPAAGPFLAAWLLAPFLAYAVSKPRTEEETPLTLGERRELRRLARKTWNFFETFVGAEDHWLPPDNFQEDPKGMPAHRTSPTNQGLLLLSTLAAHDLGYLSLPALLDRLGKTLDTLEELERYQGHFYNWYDTLTLKPLQPGYISTVDSGNLLGCLLALKQGLREKADEPIPSPTCREGLLDTLALIEDESLQKPREWVTEAQQRIPKIIDEMKAALNQESLDPKDWRTTLDRLKPLTDELMEKVHKEEALQGLRRWVSRLKEQAQDRLLEINESGSKSEEFVARCQNLADRAQALAAEMDFRFLYHEQRNLFATGYNLAEGQLDKSYYDLLASEARLASFLAIARGEVDKRHWFQLGRPLTRAGGTLVLLSWGGTMFEYLMPQILMRNYTNTLLDESCWGAVKRQIQYGRQCRTPWGVSESGFSALDGALDYQYQSFGVPGLGLKRGLGQDLVIAPYASALALMVRPKVSLDNFQVLKKEGAEGPYGFYEAVDYTRDRLAPNRRPARVRSYMAHHQGMSLVAMANCLLGNPMQRRFHAEPMVRATELLLQERIPRGAPVIQPHSDELVQISSPSTTMNLISRRLTTPHTPLPRTHLLSNGHYTVMITNTGAGFSAWHGLDVTRWREDRTRDAWGQFIYLRDLRSGLTWSAGHQPVCRPADEYEVLYSVDKAEFRRFDAGIESHLEITVSAENHAEVRRLTLTNHNTRTHDLEVTSYAEVALAPRGADLAHPAFGKLFLETEFIGEEEALLCRRRPRSSEQKPVFAMHVLAVEGHTIGGVQFETDRCRFLGRGRTTANPAALDLGSVLSGTMGPVLDPIFSLRRRLKLGPGEKASLTFTTGAADTREEALALADQYHDIRSVGRAFELAWANNQVELRHLQLTSEQVHLFQRLAGHIFFAGSVLRAAPAILAANHQGQEGLWRHGISGDKPIVLARMGEAEELPLIQQLLAAHAYWRLNGLEVDLVILNEHPTSYLQEVQEQVMNLVRGSDARNLVDKPGGVFVRQAAHLTHGDQVLVQAVARVLLAGNRGSLAAQVDRLERPASMPARFPASTRGRDRGRGVDGKKPGGKEIRQPIKPDLHFANGLGGFSSDGKEYVVPLSPSSENSRTGSLRLPPAPWINVVANPSCGFLISESGAGYTWAGNSQSNRLTPWNNDPVSDAPGEIVYLRDEDTGEFWSPTPVFTPSSAISAVLCRHGQGYTLFERNSHGLVQELLLCVAPEDPVKLVRLTIRNDGQQTRSLSATYFAELVLGTVRDQTGMHLVTEIDTETGALLARNPFNPDFGSNVTFVDVNLRPRTLTGDRTEFLGRNGSAAAPAAFGRVELSGRVGPALDPCAALQARFELKPGEAKEIVFLLGQGANVEEVRELTRRYREPGRMQAAFHQWSGGPGKEPRPSLLSPVQIAFDANRYKWDQVLTGIQVKTPNPAMDLLLNRWLLYQVLSCRVWARSAFYQSGGAFGFRDQLQDVMALVYAVPQDARAQLLRAASRQFIEGDVQHWWHPPLGRGVRTRFSDDLLWLPLVACHYVATTGDRAILDEQVPFIRGLVLKPEQEEDFGLPQVTEETATLYEHCVRALERGSRFGAHGLPLMGTGDWNDGMNRVGSGGTGESVWMGWFLFSCLRRFAELAENGADNEQARHCREQAEELRSAIEKHAWDGKWYRRAYFDDGTPLGSEQNEECKIDSIAQTWAVLSGAADADRAKQAMAAVDEFLVKSDEKMILLFTPPFDKGGLQPGYIKGYVPGIRENGGQYTHAATWVVQAHALLGHGDRAVELFDLLNPIHHAATPEQVEHYRVEPYVVAADIYGEPPHTGRGGWTWYTGSASWLYRVGLESILGFQLQGNRLKLNPCIPANWPGFEITYRHRSATYHIKVENLGRVERGVKQVFVDEKELQDGVIALVDDGGRHEVRVVMGPLN